MKVNYTLDEREIRDAIAQYLTATQNIFVSPNHVVLTPGGAVTATATITQDPNAKASSRID